MKEEQNVVSHQPSPTEHLDRKEVTARQYTHVSGKKVLPRRDLAPLGSRGDIVATEDIPNGLIGHVMTQVGEGADDPVISPARVLSCHPDYQSFDFFGNWRTAWILPVLGAVELLGDQSPIPRQDSIRFGHRSNFAERFASQSFSDLGQGTRSELDNRSREGSLALKIRFSVAKYSFRVRSSWFTEPVT